MRQPKKLSPKDFYAKVETEQLTHNDKLSIISKMILAGIKKAEIVEFIIEQWGAPRDSAYTMYRQTYGYIYQQSELNKEDIRKLNLARLEEIFDNIGDTKGEVKTKLKTIDLMNKTANIYTQDVQISNGDDSFTFDLNLDTDKK